MIPSSVVHFGRLCVVRHIRVLAGIFVMSVFLLIVSVVGAPAPVDAQIQSELNGQEDARSNLVRAGTLPMVAVDTPLTLAATDTLTQTGSTDLSPALCCSCPEGVFGAIWKGNGAIREQLGDISAPNPHYPLVAFATDTSYQPFEHGAMVWVSLSFSGTPVIYVLHGDGSFEMLTDTYDAATDPVNGGESPPPGRYEPALGFGKVWREQPGVRQALGWATAAETAGKGRSQMFYQGEMVWLSQRQETYVFMSDHANSWAGSFAVVASPTFDLPKPAPRSDVATLLVGKWVDRDLLAGQQPAAGELTLSADGTAEFEGCTGYFDLREGNDLWIGWDGCAFPDPPPGPYGIAFGSAGDVLMLSQTFDEKMPLTGGGDVWSRLGYDLWWEGTHVHVPDLCEGTVEYLDNCGIRISWTPDCDASLSPLSSSRYQYAIEGYQLSLTRYFVRVK